MPKPAFQNYQLGRKPSAHDPRNLRFARLLPRLLPSPPDRSNWAATVNNWGMGGNDRYGNCTTVTAAHLTQTWRAATLHDPAPFSDAEIINTAEQLGGLNGLSILERLKAWRKRRLFNTQLRGFAQLEPTNPLHYRLAIHLFGGADIGLALPIAWQDSYHWDVGTGRRYYPGSWGLHSVPLVAYDADNYTAVTWGQPVTITQAALLRYCDEAWSDLSPAWLDDKQTSPPGLNLAALTALLEELDG